MANKQPSAKNAAKQSGDAAPWYKDGLKFKCTGCGDCCTGAPGYVWINKAEIAAMAEHEGLEVAEFERKYVRQIGIRKSLIEYADGDCVFFDPKSRKCRVYTARPRQCRTWPFWDSTLRTPELWAETCEVCPGSGVGKLYSLDEVEATRKVVRV